MLQPFLIVAAIRELGSIRRIVAHVRRIHPRRDLAALELTQALPIAEVADEDDEIPF